MEQLLLSPLKQRIINYLKQCNFINGNIILLNYIQELENKYRNNQSCMTYLNSIRNTISLCSSVINTCSLDGTSRLIAYRNDPQLLIESEFNSVIYNINNIELLKDIMLFFESTTSTIENISERLTKLEKIIENLHIMNSQQCVSIQNIEENSVNTNYVIENIDAKL